MGPTNRRPKLQIAQLLEKIRRTHALVLLEGAVPCLGRAGEMVRREPSAVRGQGTLPMEELVTMIEPIEGILGTIVGGEL